MCYPQSPRSANQDPVDYGDWWPKNRGVDMIGEEYEVPEVLRAGEERWELNR